MKLVLPLFYLPEEITLTFFSQSDHTLKWNLFFFIKLLKFVSSVPIYSTNNVTMLSSHIIITNPVIECFRVPHNIIPFDAATLISATTN